MEVIGILVAVAAIGLFNIIHDKRMTDKAKAEADATEEAARTMQLTEAEREVALENFYGESNESVSKKEDNMNSFNYNTRGLFIEMLKKIGCQYEMAEEENDNRIFFACQGEHFFVDASDDRFYITVYDTHWGHVELYDIDEFTRLRKAINTANLNCATMTVYTIDEDAKTVDVHSKSTFPFLPQIPDLENYLRGELSDFFRAHQLVGNEMTKIREKEEALES